MSWRKRVSGEFPIEYKKGEYWSWTKNSKQWEVPYKIDIKRETGANRIEHLEKFGNHERLQKDLE